MIGTGLGRRLLRMGRAASWTAEAGRIRFFALLVATTVATLAVMGFVLASASFDGRADRSAARGARVVEAGSSARAELLWKATIASLNDRQYDVVYIEPLVENAPLPPGVGHWPKPGEVFLSPALKKADRAVLGEYGRPVGTIGAEGLEAPGEYFAYVRPTAARLDAESMAKVSGFGVPWTPALGEHLYNFGPSEFRWAYLALVGLPAALFVVIAARVGAAARDRRTAVLAALGASTGARAWFAVGEACVPVAIGAIPAGIVVGIAPIIDVPIPMVDFVLYAPDARAALTGLVVALGGVPMAVLALVVLLQPPHRADGRSTRPVAVGRRREWMLWLFPVALFGTVRGTDLAPYDLRLPVLAVGSVVTIALLPGVVGALVSAAGPVMARAGAARGRIGMLVSGRRLASGARPVARLVASVVIAIGLAAQGQIAISLFTDVSDRAEAVENHLGTSVLRVSTTMSTASADVAGFERALGREVHALAVRRDPRKGRVEVVAGCAVWRSLDVPCSGSPTALHSSHRGLAQAVSLEQSVGLRLFARTGSVSDAVRKGEDPVLMVVAADGRQLSLSRVHQAANSNLAMATRVEVFAMTGSLGGSGEGIAAQQWLQLLSVAGVLVIVVVAGIGSIAQFVRTGRELGPISVLAGSRRVYYSVSWWSLLAPTVFAVFMAVIVSWFVTSPLMASGSSRLSALSTVGAAGLLCAAVMAWWGARVASSAASVWRPRGD